MATKMLQRRGTAAAWAAGNPVLADGELGFETDTKIIKIGDGVNRWLDLSLPYLPSAGGNIFGDINMNNNGFVNLGPYQSNLDLNNNTFENIGPMVEPLNMGGYRVSNAATPTQQDDLATKAYVDRGFQLIDGVSGTGSDLYLHTGLGKIPIGTTQLIATIQGAVTAQGAINLTVNEGVSGGDYRGFRYGWNNIDNGVAVQQLNTDSSIPVIDYARIGISAEVRIDLTNEFPTFTGKAQGHNTSETNMAATIFGGRRNTSLGGPLAGVTRVSWRAPTGDAWLSETYAHLFAVVPS